MPEATPVEHEWLSHHRFVELCRTMDLGLQVSFSETFNIVSADLVNQGVPVVASADVPWMPDAYQADPTSSFDIVDKLRYAAERDAEPQRRALAEYSQESQKIWLKWLRVD